MSGHAHDHGHHHHHHGVAADADRGKLALALGLLVAFLLVEVAVAVVARSLALFSDAGHMLTDAAAIALAIAAIRLAERPARGSFTFGLRRAEILSALVNGVTLLLLGVFFTVQGIRHVLDPPEVTGSLVLIVALVGIAVNLAATSVLARANRRSLNIEGAYQHILTDLFAFIATAIAGLVMVTTGWLEADGIAALIVAAIMLHSGWGLVRESGRVLLEAAPRGVDVEQIGLAMAGLPPVVEVHDLHVWELSTDRAALAAHVIVAGHEDCHRIRLDLERLLHERFAIEHTTLQVDHLPEAVIQIQA
ncbi:MAG: cation diffusion facilitator family transporter [Baekduia sp.]